MIVEHPLNPQPVLEKVLLQQWEHLPAKDLPQPIPAYGSLSSGMKVRVPQTMITI